MRYAAKAMNIPFSSLQKRLKKDLLEPRLGPHPVLTHDVERYLVNQIKYLSSILYGVGANIIRKVSYRYREHSEFKYNFDSNSKMAGRFSENTWKLCSKF